MDMLADLARLQAENARLKAVLQHHGIAWNAPFPSVPPVPALDNAPANSPLTNPTTPLASANKVTLSEVCFVVEPMCTLRGGSHKRGHRGTLLYAIMNGVLESAVNPRLNAVFVSIDNCAH
jgi:hypothetical protein